MAIRYQNRNSVGIVRIPTDPAGAITDPQMFAVIRPGNAFCPLSGRLNGSVPGR